MNDEQKQREEEELKRIEKQSFAEDVAELESQGVDTERFFEKIRKLVASFSEQERG